MNTLIIARGFFLFNWRYFWITGMLLIRRCDPLWGSRRRQTATDEGVSFHRWRYV